MFENEAISVVLRPPRQRRSENELPWPVRKLGLAVYGSSLLTRRAKSELTALAGMLGVVALFDWLAWTFLLNAIFQTQVNEVNGKTCVAGGLAILVTSMVILFERGFITTDLTSDKRKVGLRLAVRLFLIVGAAIMTAKPVELLAFQPAIRNRTHEERVTSFAVSLLMKIGDIEQERAGLASPRREDLEPCQAYRELSGRELEFAKDQGRLKAIRSHKDETRHDLEELRQRFVSEDEAPAHEARVHQVESLLERLNRAYAGLQAKVANEKIELDFIKDRDPNLRGDCEKADTESQAGHQNRLDGLKGEASGIREYLNLLRRSNATSAEGLSIEIDGRKFAYHFEDYDLWGQLRVLEDLLAGQPAQWEGGSDSAVLAKAEKLGLTTPRNCEQAESVCSPEALQAWEKIAPALRLQAAHFSIWSWAVFGLAVLVPCLAILIKIFASQDLTHYYSLASQARNGNPDAVQISSLESAGHP